MESIDTENIAAFFQPCESEILVITFAHMDFDIAGDRFWGKEPLLKLGYASLGIACKSNCWFPYNDMSLIMQFVLDKVRRFKMTILYGFSMGGYAAIKFSRLLSADSVIALSPQYSIEPADVWANDRRLTRHFKANLNHGMAIRGDEMSGNIYLFFDPRVPEDKWNCDMIVRQSLSGTSLYLFQTPWVGHETIDVFAGVHLLGSLLTSVSRRNHTGLLKITAAARRMAHRRIFNVLKAATDRFPSHAIGLREKFEPRLSDYWRQRL